MKMLEFINNNGTLCTIIGSIITALITAMVAIIVEHKRRKIDTISNLRKEIADLKQELKQCKESLNEYKNIENQEKHIDKSTGAIYVETMPNGNKRHICGYCWENSHTKMPLMMGSYYSEDERRTVVYGDCGNCKAHCYDQ